VPFPTFKGVISDAGDAGMLLPVAAVSVAMLWILHARRAAWLLLGSVLLAALTIAALKVFFLSCGSRWQPGLISPSGHACVSAVVYGTLGTIMAAGRPAPVRAAIAVAVALLVGAIAVSRVMLGVHSTTEVLVGLLVGVAAHMYFSVGSRRMGLPPVDPKVFGVTVMATMLLAFGVHVPAESFIRHLARRIGADCMILAQAPGPAAAGRAPAVRAGARTDERADERADGRAGGADQPARSSAATSSASARAD
jgi:hypothetical protein